MSFFDEKKKFWKNHGLHCMENKKDMRLQYYDFMTARPRDNTCL